MARRTGKKPSPKTASRKKPSSKSRAQALAGDAGEGVPQDPRRRIADSLATRDWALAVRFFCQRAGIELDDGPLTRTLVPLQTESGHGFHWGRARWWAEKLLLPPVARIADCLRRATELAGDPFFGTAAYEISRTYAVDPVALGPDADENDPQAWTMRAAIELEMFADVLQHTLTALVERDEQRRQVAAIRGGPHSSSPLRAVLEHLRREHGELADETALQAVLRSVDLHLLSAPWDRLDRAVLGPDLVLRITSRDRPKQTWTPGWTRVKRVAQEAYSRASRSLVVRKSPSEASVCDEPRFGGPLGSRRTRARDRRGTT